MIMYCPQCGHRYECRDDVEDAVAMMAIMREIERHQATRFCAILAKANTAGSTQLVAARYVGV